MYIHFLLQHFFVVTFYVLHLYIKSKIERYGYSIYIWKDCNREEFYRP